ncbi:hypothetical protein Aasi_0363 [Candidatus Amoebophilus asiaticus 5a2]|uniref:Uncharacterized protein n=1 Tax=Amoebophilus asiaticus (strain 5a2) TaxID=452471 RepID=B3ERD4_AMOA5|nr:ankyrin repeat domain-containing protein [Candidatus Amoebophilus asiaticus]ACE05786.1 hypothetical protein Aasi_0363 [Candidatus Amoebophilus asiaticus 5a2]
MQLTYSKSQRLIAHILLLSISLQSCKNSPIPMPPPEQEAIESTSTSSKHSTSPQNQFTKKRENVAIISQSIPLTHLPKLSSNPTDALTHHISSDNGKKSLQADLLDELPMRSIELTPATLNSTHAGASTTTVSSRYSSRYSFTKQLQVDNTKKTSSLPLPFFQKTHAYRKQHTSPTNQLPQHLQHKQAEMLEEKFEKSHVDRSASSSDETDTEEQTSQSLIKAFIEKTSCYTVAEGYEVKFIRQGRDWSALVKDNCIPGFVRKMYLPVHQGPGIGPKDAAKYGTIWHQSHIHAYPPEKDKQGNGYVYLGGAGLKGGGETTLHQAIELGNIKEAMQIIMDASPNVTLEIVHAQDDAGNTPLHKAADKGYIKLVEKLVELGADIDLKDNYGNTALHQAAGKGCIKLVEKLVELGADIDLKDNYGNTALHQAAGKGYIKLVEKLVKLDADINVKNNNGRTPLHQAVSGKRIRTATQLIELGAQINLKDNRGSTSLMIAKKLGNNKIIKCLEEAQLRINQNLISAAKVGGHQEIITCINRGADINTTDKLGRTPLILAVIQRSEEIVHLLINKGADINKSDNEKGYNPLIWAALIDYIDITHILIEKGANLNIRDRDGNTALMIAEKLGNNKIIGCLKAAQRYINQHLISAAETGNYQEIITCINRGADVNTKDKARNTALIWAALKGYVHIGRILIKKGADINMINYFCKSALQIAINRYDIAFIRMLLMEEGLDLREEIGRSALLTATHEGYEDIVLMLIRNGVNIEARNGILDTPLMMALAKGHINIAQILIENGANVKVRNRFGRTPLMYASQWGHLDIAQILIEKGANINEQDNIGETALMNAAREGHKELVELLIDGGAAINAQDHLGQTALIYATIYGHVDIIDSLLKKKADFTQQDSRGNTALMYAVVCNQLKAVKVLVTKKKSLKLKNNAGYTALMLAAERGYTHIVKRLIKSGADINDCNKIGINSLLLAAEGGHLNTINFLIKNDAKLDGNIADPAFLRIVMDKGYTQIVKILSEAGIDVDATCSDKKPALVVAAEEGQEDIVDIFIEKRADLDKQDKDGQTALMLAIINGNVRIAEKLILAGASTTIKDYENNNAVLLVEERKYDDLLELINTPRPNYLINTIAYVPCNDRDLEGDSSGEEITDEFEEHMFEFDPEDAETLPFKIKSSGNQKTPQPIVGTVSTEDIKPRTVRKGREVKSSVIQPFLEKLSQGAFYKPNSPELQRVAVSFALNRPRSLSTRRNNCLSRELSAKVNSAIPHKKFATFWNYPWYDQEDNPIDYNTVRSFYKQLKRYDKEHGTNQAEFFREVNEDNVKHHVPYQSLRERLKIHRNTKTLARQYKKNNSIAPIYFSIIDSDVINFNGIYTSYDQIYLDSKLFSTTLPIVMTTGYEFPAKAEELPENFDSRIKKMVLPLKFASQLDRVTRIATASVIPLGVYYPEPNLCILLPKNKSTLPESFEGKDSKEKGKGNLESAILLRQVKNRSGINEDSFIFSDKPPLITTIPDRAARSNHGYGDYLSFSDSFQEGQYHRISINDIEKLIMISQSHTEMLSWAGNLYVNRVVSLNGMKYRTFRGKVGKFYASVHPLFSKDIRKMKREIKAILTQERVLQVKDNQGLLAEGDRVRVEDAIKETIIATSELLSKLKIINLFDNYNYETAITQDNTPSGPCSINITELISSTETQISSLRELVQDNHISLSPKKLKEFENLLQGLEDSIEEMKNPPLFSFPINPYDPYPNRQFAPQEEPDSKGVFKVPTPILGKRKRVTSKDDEDATKKETDVSQPMDVASVQNPISPYQENRNKQVRFTQPQRLNAEEGNNNSSSAFGKLHEQRASVNSVNNKKRPQPSHPSSRKKLRTTSERSEDYEEGETTHNKKSNSSLSNTQNSAVQPFNQPYLVHEEEDPLQEFYCSDLGILTRVDMGNNLPIAKEPLRIVEDGSDTYQINGKEFRRQNVSGEGMDCFFNAAGLEREEQIARLKKHKDNETVRAMIANEIISAAKSSHELPEEVKEVINYTLYESQIDQINRLKEDRNRQLAAQSVKSEEQDLDKLPSVLQNIDRKEEKVLAALRQRASTVEAYIAFINHHIGKLEMMVSLHDVKGDDPQNKDRNYTSIDAIAYINQLGIKIYQPENGELRLIHQFFPTNAAKIVYLYHSGIHFQALIPE